ncbi:isocitrate lyase [Naematelia encephala]|uniref:methylisocitrate lyase n=1 Tax=Naematelia encephala TaxID=71784 RepID=A0A1Y2BDL1_9TREE|nr:isocitrate lyase [Naematelia encephala]
MSDEWLSPEAIEAWWASPSQKALKRPYTAAAVANLRDPFPENTTSNAMALRLRAILEKHHRAKTVNLTTSPLEMSSQQMMAEAGMETAYVSGGVASFTAVTDPSSDHADYTYDTLPKKVELLQRAQKLNTRIARAKGNKDADSFMLPLIADADSGFGLYTTVMKLAKLFVQAGAAGFHIDDLFPGAKRFDGKDGEAWVIVPMCELQKRLTAARLQLDIMGSELVVFYRADPHSATRITSSVDPRDRPYILGATVELPRHYASLTTSPERAEWKTKAKLLSLDDAFKAAYPEKYDEFSKKTEGLNVSEALPIATKLAPEFYFSADAARNSSGYYAYNGCVEASIARTLEIAHLVDVCWPNASWYEPVDVEKYAKGVHAVHPDKWLGYNITGSFPEDGSLDPELKVLNQKIAEWGYCWQFMPLAMFTALGVAAKNTAVGLMQGGTNFYVENVSRPASKAGGKDSVEWWYKKPAILTDTAAEVIGDCM